MTTADLYSPVARDVAADKGAYGRRDGAASPLTTSNGGAAGEIFRGRTASLARVTTGLETLVEERQRLRDEVLEAIDRDQTTLTDLLLAMYRPGVVGTDNPVYVKLRVEQLRLERERRQVTVECWRDTALLAKDLIEQTERGHEAVRIGGLLGSGGP